eukprot:766494-Hanusia_phi.AAC.3
MDAREGGRKGRGGREPGEAGGGGGGGVQEEDIVKSLWFPSWLPDIFGEIVTRSMDRLTDDHPLRVVQRRIQRAMEAERMGGGEKEGAMVKKGEEEEIVKEGEASRCLPRGSASG